MSALLEVDDLSVAYRAEGGDVAALRGVSLTAQAGEVIGIVGESGCGKSTLAAALIALLDANADVTAGEVRLNGRDILSLHEDARRKLRGRDIAMIFQDPMTAFSPVLTMGDQIIDFQQHTGLSRAARRERARQMLLKVGIADADLCLRRYPHELSGGMRQRAAVAAALMANPALLVADEPTTALDVTMEAQIIHLLRSLRTEINGAIVIVTHHLGVIGELCDRVYVMYAGQVVEEAPVDDLYHAPRHPYTRALIACDPGAIATRQGVLPTIPGRPPDLAAPPPGCSFAPRCPQADATCRSTAPPRVRVSDRQAALCHKVVP
ncbi:MAG: ATP-binding cassette domain-containing protein [Limimaricola sp.]|uniref:ABC transporter ATP-binding protein n=1 Tax=Limimaricola sp. TaxID=2211665 RepID=UPI001D62F11A|nr:ABC transporter ATP-binding protein [Limimaricola sp.]MBI1417868.1 ATP-binding cassette domain-containing protein [Limimaricola sp.]